VFLDTTYCKARLEHRVVSQAVVAAQDGRREVLGFDVGDSENATCWTTLLLALKARHRSGCSMSRLPTLLDEAAGKLDEGTHREPRRPLIFAYSFPLDVLKTILLLWRITDNG